MRIPLKYGLNQGNKCTILRFASLLYYWVSLYTNIRKGSLNSTKWGSKMHHLSFRPLVVLNNEVNFKHKKGLTK